MGDIDKRIQKARPKLRAIAPLSYLMTWVFAIGNFFLAPAFLMVRPGQFPIVNTVLTGRVWACVFFVLGLSLVYGLLSNRWSWTRRTLFVGMFSKSMWMYALLVLMIHNDRWTGVYGTVALWALISFLQAALIIEFLPKGLPTHHYGEKRSAES